MTKLKKSRLTKPKSIISRFREDIKEELNVRGGDLWKYRDLWDKTSFRNFRSIGRAGFILLEIIEQMDAGKPEVAHATAIQGWKAIRQFTLDQGSWQASWPLSLLPDPYEQNEWGGTHEEMAAVAGFLRAKADLKEKVHPKGSAALGGSEGDAGEGQPTGRGGGRGRKGKAKGEGRGGDAAAQG